MKVFLRIIILKAFNKTWVLYNWAKQVLWVLSYSPDLICCKSSIKCLFLASLEINIILKAPYKRGHWGVPNTVRKIGKYQNTVTKIDEIPCQYGIYDRSRLLKAVSILRVCLPQACMHQKSTSDINCEEM